MSIQSRTTETVSDAQTTNLREGSSPLGIDEESVYHVYRTIDEPVNVIEDDERRVRYKIKVFTKSINDWIDYVKVRHDGFEVHHLYKTFSDALENERTWATVTPTAQLDRGDGGVEVEQT